MLDTQTLLWLASADPALPLNVKEKIRLSPRPRFVSIVSAWEVAIKAGLGKLDLDLPISELFGAALSQHGVELLSLEIEDTSDYKSLEFPDPNHRDPFDRMIVVQATRRNLAIVSSDNWFDNYAPQRIWK